MQCPGDLSVIVWAMVVHKSVSLAVLTAHSCISIQKYHCLQWGLESVMRLKSSGPNISNSLGNGDAAVPVQLQFTIMSPAEV